MSGALLLAVLLITPPPHHAKSAVLPAAAPLDTARIEQLTGAKGRLDAAEGVFKVSVPRTDLAVTVGGVKLVPAAGLTSWAAFERAGAGEMVMGDLVLTEGQVNPVMSAALETGLEVTALHNHFLGETPRVMFMHIAGTGGSDRLAEAVGRLFAMLHDPGGPIPTADVDPASTQLDTAAIAGILGRRGDLGGGVYKVTIGRSAQMHGHPVRKTMGVNTWAAFAGTDEHAVVDGDFAMLEPELQPVLRALRHADIEIVAIHQHMTGETPRIVFLHYWGVGRAQDLARGLRAALERTKP